MATKTIFGYVPKDRSGSPSGSSDYTIAEKVKSGIYTIIFDTPFNDTPIVVASCVQDQTDRGISIHATQIDQKQVQLVMMNTSNQTPYDENFNFIAIGTGGD